MTDRYDTSNLIEDQYEPGSNGKVLRNKLGFVDPVEMGVAETNALWHTQEKLISEVSIDQSFTVQSLCKIHEQWLKGIYPWAGQLRAVNISKGGFDFAQARFLPALMDEFERKQLRTYTPCRFESRDEITHALAEVHVELMLIIHSGKGTADWGAF